MSFDSLNLLLDKIISPRDAVDAVSAAPGAVVFTNGVFDILHRGHVSYLARARSLGARLLVALNTDDSVRRLGKRGDRPINSLADRATVLAALEAVDYVTSFDEDTPCRLLEHVRPHVYVKGGDYDIETLEETRLVRSWGGEVYALPFIDGYSSTALIERLRSNPTPQ